MKNWILIFASFFLIAHANALVNTSPKEFQSKKVRNFDKRKLSEFRQEHKYTPSNKSFDPISQRMKEGKQRVDEPAETKKDRSFSFKTPQFNLGGLQYILFAILLIGFIILIYHLAGGNFKFNSRNRSYNDDDIFDENVNIHELDFAAQIEMALSRNDFTEAAKLHFLRSLKNLNDKAVIRWEINKTNKDYFYEIKDMNLRKQFSQLSSLFEYLAYGEFTITEEQFSQVKTLHSDFDASF